jgi:citrate lyase subunit beta/citryl-CoA lyase
VPGVPTLDWAATRCRSWLFVPGNSVRYLEKALACEADVLLVDLEDGVQPTEKEAARDRVAEYLSTATDKVRFVRVNAEGTGLLAGDLDAVVLPGIAGICLPKAESTADVDQLSARIDELEHERGIDTGSVRILAAIESARGLLAAPAIAAANPRIAGLMFGAEDFALDLGLLANRQQEAANLSFARSSIVVAAVSAGVIAVDGVFPRLDDESGLIADTRRSRDLGFSGKATFSPRQLPLIHSVFQPASEEIDFSRRVVAAFEAALEHSAGAAIVDGQLVDLPIVMRARRVLHLASAVDTS